MRSAQQMHFSVRKASNLPQKMDPHHGPRARQIVFSMRVVIDELTVHFPYERIYPEQHAYMVALKRLLDAGGHGVLEMPSGTGKTVTLLALIIAYHVAHPERVAKLVYCTRTVPEVDKTLAELRRLIAYREHATGESLRGFLGVGLSSRKNLCVNERVLRDADAGVRDVDAGCHARTAPWVRARAAQGAETCDFFENIEDVGRSLRRAPGPRVASLSKSGGELALTASNGSDATPLSPNGSDLAQATGNGSDATPLSENGSDLAQTTRNGSDATRGARRRTLGRTTPEGTGVEQDTGAPPPRRAQRTALPEGVYTMDDLRAYGVRARVCPYFAARLAIRHASVVVYSYHYLLDPKVAEVVSAELPHDAVVVFDEAHNIDNVCIEALSLEVTRRTLDAASRALRAISAQLEEARTRDADLLRAEYERLVAGLADDGRGALPEDAVARYPLAAAEVADGAVPGSIRRAEHYVALMRRVVEFLRVRLSAAAVTTDTPASFAAALRDAAAVDARPLRHATERLASLVRALELSGGVDGLGGLQRVAHLCTIVGTHVSSRGFVLLMEPFDEQSPGVSDPVLRLACLDATLAMRPVFARFRSVVVTSGTLSPLEMYPRLLDFGAAVLRTFPMSLPRDIFSPLVVTHGADQVALTSRFDVRSDAAVVRNYGALLVEMARVTPDGLVAFFPSYVYLEMIVAAWHETGVLADAARHKLVFVETPDGRETAVALHNYRRAVEAGRGAAMLCVARGKVSEGIDFDHAYGRAVIVFGVPYQYTESRVLKARLEYVRAHCGVRESDFLAFDALRHAAQCLGRVIRGKADYGLMVLADRRYGRHDKRAKLPAWIGSAISDASADLPVDVAVQLAQRFFREMAQPFDASGTRTALAEEDLRAVPADTGAGFLPE